MSNPKFMVEVGVKLSEFEKGMKTVQQRLDSVGAGMMKAGKIMSVGLTAPLVAFAAKSVQAFNVQAQAEQQLLVALGRREDVQKRLIEQAQELQGQTLFGDEETIRAQALIAAFVDEESAIKRIIPLVQDMAQAKGMQLANAADLVAKTLGSTTNAMSRYGIEVTGAVGSTERLETLANGLAEAFGGTAQAAANAGTGGLTQLKNAFGDLQEQIGELVYNNLKPFVETLTNLTKSLQNLSDNTKQTAVNAAAFLAVLGPITIFIGALATNIARLMEIAPKFAKWLFGVSGGATVAGAALVGLSADALSTAKDIESFRGTIQKTLETMGDGMSIEDVNALIVEQAQKIEDLKNNFRGTTAAAVEAHQGQIRVAEETLNALVKIRDNKAHDQLKEKINTSTDSAKELNTQLNEVAKPRVIQIIKDPEIMYEGLGLMEAFYKVQQAAKKNGFEAGDMLPPDLIMGLDDIVSNFEQMGNQIGEKLPEQMSKLNEISQMFVEGLSAGLAQIIIQGGNLGDMFKEIGKQLLKSGLTKLLTAFLTGGSFLGIEFFGKGSGGLLGSLLPKVFGGGASAGAMVPALTGQNVMIGGQFQLKGTDLVASITKTQNSILR